MTAIARWPRQIDPATLSPAQYNGAACVVHGGLLQPGMPRVAVGLLGPTIRLHYVYACLLCARTVTQLVLELITA